MNRTAYSFTATAAVIAAVFLAAVAPLRAQSYSPIYDGSGNDIAAGVTPWAFDVNSAGAIIGQGVKQVAHGDTTIIAPRVLDGIAATSAPRAWPTNTQFVMWYQAGAGMATSNQWWTNSAVTFPVWHDVAATVSTGAVYWAVTNATTFTYSNSVIIATNTVCTTNQFTNTVQYATTVRCVDTGRVAIAWTKTNDYGRTAYDCWLLAQTPAGANISQPVRFRMEMLVSPGYLAADAPIPVGPTTALLATMVAWSNALASGTAVVQTNLNAEASIRYAADGTNLALTVAAAVSGTNHADLVAAAARTNANADAAATYLPASSISNSFLRVYNSGGGAWKFLLPGESQP